MNIGWMRGGGAETRRGKEKEGKPQCWKHLHQSGIRAEPSATIPALACRDEELLPAHGEGKVDRAVPEVVAPAHRMNNTSQEQASEFHQVQSKALR